MGLSCIPLLDEANIFTCYITCFDNKNKTRKMEKELVKYRMLQVRGSMVLDYEFTEFHKFDKSEESLNIISATKLTYGGEISAAGQKRMKRILMCWAHSLDLYNSSLSSTFLAHKRKIVFITLTLPSVQINSDREIKDKCLKPFMRVLREKFDCKNYIWKAESQENGNIHFHILIDRYVDFEKVQEMWNCALNNLSYIDSFERKFNHRNPPSTRTELVLNQADMESYIMKYIGKNEGRRLIEGAVWKSSKALSTLKYFEIERDTRSELNLQVIVTEKKGTMKILENLNLYYVNNTPISSILSATQCQFWRCYCIALREFLFYPVFEENFNVYYHNLLITSNLHKRPEIAPVVEKWVSIGEKPTQLKLFSVEKKYEKREYI